MVHIWWCLPVSLCYFIYPCIQIFISSADLWHFFMCNHCSCRVHNERISYELEFLLSPSEQVLCVGSSRKQPVLKWEDNMAWPGKLTLTEKALYFEVLPSGYLCCSMWGHSPYNLSKKIHKPLQENKCNGCLTMLMPTVPSTLFHLKI